MRKIATNYKYTDDFTDHCPPFSLFFSFSFQVRISPYLSSIHLLLGRYLQVVVVDYLLPAACLRGKCLIDLGRVQLTIHHDPLSITRNGNAGAFNFYSIAWTGFGIIITNIIIIIYMHS